MTKNLTVFFLIVFGVSILIFVLSEKEVASDDDNVNTSSVNLSRQLDLPIVKESLPLLTIEESDAQEAVSSEEPIKYWQLDFESNWCLSLELNKNGQETYKEAINEINLQHGHILFIDHNKDTNSNDSNAYLIEPYRDISIDSLVQHILSDNEYAMIAALKRTDTPSEFKDRSADRLLTLGKVSAALPHMVIRNLSKASVDFNQNGEINPELKNALINALIWTNYSLMHKDLNTLSAFSISINQFKDVDVILNSLTEQDRFHVSEGLTSLIDNINKNRELENLPIHDFSDVSKGLQRKFDHSLDLAYKTYPEIIAFLNESEFILKGGLTPSQCAKKIMQYRKSLLASS